MAPPAPLLPPSQVARAAAAAAGSAVLRASPPRPPPAACALAGAASKAQRCASHAEPSRCSCALVPSCVACPLQEVRKYAKSLAIECTAVFGGSGISNQISELKRGSEVRGTPCWGGGAPSPAIPASAQFSARAAWRGLRSSCGAPLQHRSDALHVPEKREVGMERRAVGLGRRSLGTRPTHARVLASHPCARTPPCRFVSAQVVVCTPGRMIDLLVTSNGENVCNAP